MTDNTSRTLTDDGTEQRELHTEDLVASARPEPVAEAAAAPTAEAPETGSTPLVGDVEGYRRRWEAVQTGFVDEPRRAVENADALVAEVITELASSFAQERDDLEGQWSKGDEVSTEDLRVSLRRYRSFFDRLLSA